MSAPIVGSDASEEDLLEKMLKEAEMLAAKMTVPPNRDESASPAVVTPTAESAASPTPDHMDPLLDKAERMVRAMREATDGGSGSIHTSTDTVSLLLKRLDDPAKQREGVEYHIQGDGAEILRQSQPVLQKRPSGSIDSPLGSSTKEDAPTSVYVLHHNSGADDFSSVGSSSLKAPSLSGDNRATSVNDAINASLSMADAIKEIQSAGSRSPPHQPGTPTPSAPDDDGDDDEVSVKDYTSVSSSSEHKKKMLVMAAKLEAGIPDFRVTSPDAKWEKVASAARGDDDYASIQDYTKESPKKKLVQTIVDAPVKQSRLRAYRVQARRRRRRQRTLLAAVIVVAVLYYFVFGFGSGNSKNENNETAPPASTAQLDTESNENFVELGSNVPDEMPEQELSEHYLNSDEHEDEIYEEYEVDEVNISELSYWSEEDDETIGDDPEEEGGEDAPSGENMEVKQIADTTTQTTALHAHRFMVTTESGRLISCQNPLNRFFRKPCRILFKELRLAKQSGITGDQE